MLAQYEIIIKAIIALMLVSAGFGCGYEFRDLTAKVDISALESKISDIESKASEEKAKSANDALKKQQALAEHFVEIDKTKTEELKNANGKYQEVLACIRRGNGCGMRVPTIPAGMPENTSAGMDDGKETARQDGQAAERIITVGHECDQSIYQLQGLQDLIEAFNKQAGKTM